MGWIVLGAYGVYLGLAFGLRTLVHYRATGSTGFRGIAGAPGSLEWCGGVLLALAVVGGVLAPVLDVLGALRPFPALALWQLELLGAALFGVGLAGTLWSQHAMGTSWRIGVDSSERTELVAQGPFRRVRNPIFTFMVVTALGLTLLLPNLAALMALGALVLGVEIQVRAVEEPHLIRIHGQRYLAWAAETGRFMPWIGRRRPESRGGPTQR